MPTLYWGPWLAKIRRGGPEGQIASKSFVSVFHTSFSRPTIIQFFFVYNAKKFLCLFS